MKAHGKGVLPCAFVREGQFCPGKGKGSMSLHTNEIRVVMLDVDNTLLDFNRCAVLSAKAAGAVFGFEVPDTLFGIFKPINDALWKDLEKGVLTSAELFDIRWQRIFEAMGLEEGLKVGGKAFEREFQRHLETVTEPIDGALELIRYLSGKYILSIASNGPYNQQVGRLISAEMMPYIGIEHVFVSAEVGETKPQKPFFDVCFQRLSKTLGPLKAGEVCMIGDSLSADIAGAKEYGMQTIWYDHDRRGRDADGAGMADVRVESLPEIHSLL